MKQLFKKVKLLLSIMAILCLQTAQAQYWPYGTKCSLGDFECLRSGNKASFAQSPETNLPKKIICSENAWSIYHQVLLMATNVPGTYKGVLKLIEWGSNNVLGSELVRGGVVHGYDGTKLFMVIGESILGDFFINLNTPVAENTYRTDIPIIDANGTQNRIAGTCHLSY